MDKKKIIVASIIAALVIFTCIGLFIAFTKTGKGNNKPDESSEVSTEQSTEIGQTETEIVSEPTETVSANNIEDDVELTIDFKFDTKVKGNYYSFENNVTDESSMLELEPVLQARIRRDVEETPGWIYLDSDHVVSVNAGYGVDFVGAHSNARFNVYEQPLSYSYDDLKYQAFRNLIGYKSGEVYIPFGAPYVLGKGFEHPERYYSQASDGTYGKDAVTEYYQILFDTSLDTTLGTVYMIGYYDKTSNDFRVDGYIRHESGRSFIFHGYDTTDTYMLAYVSDLFDNCIVLVE